MLLGASRHLRADGEVWIVVVEPLEASIDEILGHPSVRVIDKVPRGEHIVYHYTFGEPVDVDPNAYVRGRDLFKWRDCSYDMTPLHGLAEFDTLSWGTKVLLDVVVAKMKGCAPRSVLVSGPGQGHIPVVLLRTFKSIERMVLVSRDLLALRATVRNLAQKDTRGEIRQIHSVGLTGPDVGTAPDLIVMNLNHKEGLDVNCAKIASALDAGGDCPVIIGCPASFGSRLEKALRGKGIRMSGKKKRKAFCAMSFR
jgi:16S rRNA G1207 methylase RsmC